jgi:hypothetical protein
MTKEEKSAIVIAWSKVALSLLIIRNITEPEWYATLTSNLSAAQKILERIMEANKIVKGELDEDSRGNC